MYRIVFTTVKTVAGMLGLSSGAVRANFKARQTLQHLLTMQTIQERHGDNNLIGLVA